MKTINQENQNILFDLLLILYLSRIESGSLNIDNYNPNDDKYNFIQKEMNILVNKLITDLLINSFKEEKIKHLVLLKHSNLSDDKFVLIFKALAYNKFNTDYTDNMSINTEIDKLKNNNIGKYYYILHLLSSYSYQSEYILVTKNNFYEKDLLFNNLLSFDYYTTLSDPLSSYVDLYNQYLLREIISIDGENKQIIPISSTELSLINEQFIDRKYLNYALNEIKIKNSLLNEEVVDAYAIEINMEIYPIIKKHLRNNSSSKLKLTQNYSYFVLFYIEKYNLKVKWFKEEDKSVLNVNAIDNCLFLDILNKDKKFILKQYNKYKIVIFKIEDEFNIEVKCSLVIE